MQVQTITPVNALSKYIQRIPRKKATRILKPIRFDVSYISVKYSVITPGDIKLVKVANILT